MNYKFYNTITFGMWVAGLVILRLLFQIPIHPKFDQQQIQQIVAGAR